LDIAGGVKVGEMKMGSATEENLGGFGRGFVDFLELKMKKIDLRPKKR
jgi:hypothetical protein